MNRAIALILSAAAIVGCSNPTEPPPADRVISVSLSPASGNIVSGQSLQFIATVSATGNASRKCDWSANAPSGLFNNTSPGTYTVRCTSDEDPTKYDEASIEVRPAPVFSIVFWMTDNFGNQDLYLTTFAGDTVKRLTDFPEQDLEPTWSPDGKRIAFYHGGHIAVVNGDGSGFKKLTNGRFERTPAWSPDGTKIAYQGSVGTDFNIFVMDSNGTNQVQITFENCGSKCPGLPSWSPDGRFIAYETHRDGNWEVYRLDLQTEANVNLTNSPGTDEGRPAYSPNGSEIAYNTFPLTGNDSQIWRMNSDGTGQVNISQNSMSDVDPRWLPNGSGIIFAGDYNRDPQLTLMNRDGSNRRTITNLNHQKGQPSARQAP